jgi:hypothetical protein
VPAKIKLKKQFKPIGFADRPKSGTVESHRNAMAEAAEKRHYNRIVKELETEKASCRGGLRSRVMGFFGLR